MKRRLKFDVRCLLGAIAVICFCLAILGSFENLVVGFLVTVLLGNFCAAVIALLIVFFVRHPEPTSLDECLEVNPNIDP